MDVQKYLDICCLKVFSAGPDTEKRNSCRIITDEEFSFPKMPVVDGTLMLVMLNKV